jgi:competence protein ComEC
VLNALALTFISLGGVLVLGSSLLGRVPQLAAGVALMALGGGLAIADRVYPSAHTAPAAPAHPAPRASAPIQRSASARRQAAPEIRFVDVGQGDGVVMRIGGKIIVSDAGENNVQEMDAALHGLGATAIDVAILSHPHQDHDLNFVELVQSYGWKVHTVVLSHSDYWQGTGTNKAVISALTTTGGAQLQYVAAGDRFTWGGAKWEILSPPANTYTAAGDVADSSVVYRLGVNGASFLFTGDIGEPVAKDVATRWTSENLGSATVYLATHHGSSHGSQPNLLAATHPKWAILSTGNNSFHHPTLDAIARLEGTGATIWCTDTNGTVAAKVSSTGDVTWKASKQPIPWWSGGTHTETGFCVGR